MDAKNEYVLSHSESIAQLRPFGIDPSLFSGLL
jgi:hypothetical protein